MPHRPRGRLRANAAALVMVMLGIGALRLVVSQYGAPVAGVFLDPDGIVSNVGNPAWEGARHGLRFPDRLVAVEGKRLDGHRGDRTSAWDAAVARAWREGRSLRATFATSRGEVTVELPVRPLEPLVWWIFGGSVLFIGSLYAGTAVLALRARPDGPLARTFAKTALLVASMLFTLLDYHTTRALVPVFETGLAMVPLAFVGLALRLPEDVDALRRWPWLIGALDAVGIAFALAMFVSHATGGTTHQLRSMSTGMFGASLIFFVVVLVTRFFRATGTPRMMLRALLGAMVPAHAVLGLALVLGTLSLPGSNVAFLIFPAFLVTPLYTVVAFIRHDLWGSRALLSRVIARLVVGVVISGVAAAFGGGIAAAVGVPVAGAMVAAGVAAPVCAALVVWAFDALDRTVFSARERYKPTVAELSEELTLLTVPEDVASAIERTVTRWLPCEAHFFPAEEDSARLSQTQDSGERPVLHGSESGALGDPELLEDGSLRFDVAFRGKSLGHLDVGPKAKGALFTTDDLDLLRTIVNQAALAVAHARNYAELERRRREEAAAWREERSALLETVAAEILHEVRYPIAFFRSLFKRGAGARMLDPVEVDIGCDEVDRLERMVAGLRRVAVRKLERRVLRIAELVHRVELLVRDRLEGRRLEVDIGGGGALRCDVDQATQVLVNLVSNALDAAGPRGRVGIMWSSDRNGGKLVVWDDGPGPLPDTSKIFNPWFTTKPGGTGLGLAITYRIARAHGWDVDANREAGTTRFVVSVPTADVVGGAEEQVVA